MQGLRSNSALFGAPEKVVVRQPLLIFSPRLALQTPENVAVTYQFRRLLGAQEGGGEVGTSDFLPTLGVGDPRQFSGYIAIPPLFGASRRQGWGSHF